MTGWALAAVTVAYAAFLAMSYNRFVRARQHLRESWSGIDVELRRRYDLVPTLVATVKGHAAHEQRLLEQVLASRTRAQANRGAHDTQIRDETALAESLASLLAVAERYPELTADESFRDLQARLTETEDRLAVARRHHNANVREWQTLGESFPSKLARGLVRWRPEPYFAVPPAVRDRPDVAGSAPHASGGSLL